MKLGFVFDVCFHKYNGEYYAVNLSQELWKNKYLPYFDEIVVVGREKIVYEDPSHKLVRSDSDRVHFKCLPNQNKINRIFSQGKESNFIEQAISDCDFVICRSWWGCSTCKKLNKKYMIEVVSCAWDSMWNHSIIGKLLAVPFYLKQRLAIKKAPYSLYVTNEFLQRRYPCDGVTVGVSDVMINCDDYEKVMHNRLKKISEHNKLTLGTAAAVNVKYKGQRFVIKALYLLKKMGYDCFKYQLAGGGDNSSLKKLVNKYGLNDDVEFIGSLPHNELFEWYDSIDVYIQPSLQEGLPRSVVEAMSRGVPCICLNTGGMPELVAEEYVCERRGNISKNIADKILMFMDKRNMQKASQSNIEKSKEFYPDVLENKRKGFMHKFINQE